MADGNEKSRENSGEVSGNPIEKTSGLLRRKRRCFVGILLLAATIVLLAGLFWGFFLRTRPLTVSPETTGRTEPLTPDGQRVDYAAALLAETPSEMSTDDNAARILVRRFGAALDQFGGNFSDAEKERRERNVRVRLGLDPETPPESRFLGPEDAYAEYLLEKFPELSGAERRARRDAWDQERGNPFRVEADPAFTDWYLSEYGGALDAAADAMTRPHFLFSIAVDSPTALASDTGNQSARRDYAQGLFFRARTKILAGQLAPAAHDLLALRRFATLLGREPNSLNDLMVGLALGGLEFGQPIFFTPNGEPDANALASLLDEPFQAPSAAALDRLFDREETLLLDTLVHFSQNDSESLARWSVWFDREGVPSGFFRSGLDWNLVFRTFRETLAHFRADPDQSLFEIEALRHDDTRQNLWFSEEYRAAHPEMSEIMKMPSGWFSPRWWTSARRSEFLGRKVAERMIFQYRNVHRTLEQYQCQSNLRRIVVAMQLYRIEHDGAFPPAFTVDGEGRPLHSWRVLLLPYLGEKELFGRIRLEEPWDSEANRALHASGPEVYRCPEAEEITPERLRVSQVPGNGLPEDGALHAPGAGEASYSVIVGPNTYFDGSGKGVTPTGANERSLPTILVTERLDPVCWMKPDAELTEENAEWGVNPIGVTQQGEAERMSGSLASLHDSGVNVGMLDGASLTLSHQTPPEVVKELVTCE